MLAAEAEPERSPNSGVIIGNSVGGIADGKLGETPRKRYAIPAVLRTASLGFLPATDLRDGRAYKNPVKLPRQKYFCFTETKIGL